MEAATLGLPPGGMRRVFGPRAMKATMISTGCISASDANCVQHMPIIEPGQNSAPLMARDVLGSNWEFRYNRRMTGPYYKQTITGMRPFFQHHGLVPGDLITIYRMRDEAVIYYIHFQRP
ncbi:hypothetical protein SLEP1_g19506 [Rubroshorea leprosula]|uniref:TF-B3 domain-containing protein n=1 Tax=Rubroshorea leprosula TaxID=152421 RepID=A0AAV5JA88_9ROSI|nr:hypothetical protein SLEP1_g19506 [Rubroshorea leprosula]